MPALLANETVEQREDLPQRPFEYKYQGPSSRRPWTHVSEADPREDADLLDALRGKARRYFSPHTRG